MRNCTVFFLLFNFLFNSCKEENDDVLQQVDEQGVLVSTPFLWKTSLHQKEPISNSHISNKIIYNEKIVIPLTNGKENRTISLINTKDGKIIWQWNDLYEEEYIDINFHYQYQNLLTYQIGSRSYCINLDNGESKWKIRRDRSFDVRLNPYGQYFFMIGPDLNNGEYESNTYLAFKTDILSGEISDIMTGNFTFEHPDCRRGISHIVEIAEQENLLLVSYAENLPDWITQNYLGIYDTNLKEWIWDKVLVREPMNPNFIYHPPLIVNKKIYTAIVNTIVCNDLETGKQLWRKDFNADFMFSGIIVEEGKVIANCEDTYAYALDAETGSQRWRVRTAGSGSRMSYLNGVVYFVGGSARRLFAIEAATGKMLWKIDAGLLGEGRGAGFRTNAVYVLPAKDDQPAKVIALSDLYAYCFEAER